MFPTSFKCIICGNEYVSKQKLRKHEEAHQPCIHCGYVSQTCYEKKMHTNSHLGKQDLEKNKSKQKNQDDVQSLPAANKKRYLSLETSLRKCEDCDKSIKTMNWFDHCGQQEHKKNVQKSFGNRVKSHNLGYRFLKEDSSLNAEDYWKEAKIIFNKVLNNSLADNLLINFNLELATRNKLASNVLISEKDITHTGEMTRLSRADDVEGALETQINIIKTKLSKLQEKDADRTLIQIKWLDVNINKTLPSLSSDFVETPLDLANKKACINVKNNDTYSLKWSLIAAFHDESTINCSATSTYGITNITDTLIVLDCGRVLDFTEMTFPAVVKDINKFEENNCDISINVFGYDSKSKTIIGPFYITKSEKQFHINLIMLESEYSECHHYILIKDISRLLSNQQTTQNRESMLICNVCLYHTDSPDKMTIHKEKECGGCIPKITEREKRISKNKNSESELELPFAGCTDFECIIKDLESESTSTSISSNISKPIATKCVFCAQTLGINDRPKLLECLHVTCSQCMSTKFAELDRTMPPLIHCPICNMASQNEFIIDNQFLIEHCTGAGEMSSDPNDSTGSKTSTNIPCSSCSDNNIATSWCVDCSEYICDSCVQAHQRLKITKDHTIKPKEEANNEQSPSSAVDKLHMCVLHPQEKLSLYCETCEKLTCRDCQLSDHRDHKYKFAHEIATETRHAITSMVAEINYKRFLLTSAMQVIAERQKVISDKKKELIKEITAMVVTITNTVNMRGKQLVMRLNEVCDGKLKLLVDKRDSLISLSDNTDYCIDFIANVLDKGSDYAILSSKKSLVRHLQKLKCQRADIPNPDIPLRIDLQMCQIQQLQKEISRLGNILVDGKPYPPQPSPPPPQQQRQQPSPNMAPPLRPGMPPGMQAGMSPGGPPPPPGGFGPQNGPGLYNSNSPQQHVHNMQMNRNFAGEGPVRYGGLPPSLAMQRQGQPHVSSSTHPQNMDISLRGLLNNQAAQSPNQPPHMPPFNGPPSYPGGPQGAPSPQQMGPQMRQHFMAGPPGQQHQNYAPTPPGGPNNPNFMNNSAAAAAAARFQSYQRMSSHAQQQAAVAAMASTGQGQIPSPNAMQRPQMHHNPMQNNMGFHGNQPGFNAGHPQTSPQLGAGAGGGGSSSPASGMHMAKWHIPQSAQSCSQQGPNLMRFANGHQTENFKISLKSPNTLKNTTPPTTGSSAGHGMPGGSGGSNIPAHGNNPILNAASLGLSPAVSILPNVTSTNPKTPSPSTHETSKDFTEPIDKVRDDSINDLMATIAKLDSNGVQVLPEGRTKTTSPQVHSSTDLSNTQEVHNTKTTEKDDPNEDWCAVCLDGGELMCCDKCPKVFHQNCHIPAISSLPDESESWQCLLCVNLKELASNPDNLQKNPGELSRLELQILQRICLELFCQYEQSLHFREPEPPSNTTYYEIVCNPMSLDVIRTRLDPSSPNHYKDISSFIADVRLIFKNTYLFYQEDSKTYTNAKYLENFFEEQLSKWLPSYANKSINITSANNILNNTPGSVITNGNNSNSASTSASPAPGAPSPSLENGGRKSTNSAMLNINTNSNGSNASTHRSDDNIDDGCNPAKRLRKQTE